MLRPLSLACSVRAGMEAKNSRFDFTPLFVSRPTVRSTFFAAFPGFAAPWNADAVPVAAACVIMGTETHLRMLALGTRGGQGGS